MDTKTENKKTRRTKIVKLQVEDAQSKIKQAEALRLKAEQALLVAEQEAEQARLDELQNMEEIRTHVTEHCTNEGYFCGVILNHEAIIALVKFALENPNEQIKIPFQLYSIEEPETLTSNT
jgi:hypothetical protein